MRVRDAEARDAKAWASLREELWPGSAGDHAREIAAYFRGEPPRWVCLVAEDDSGGLAGFLEVGLRDYAEGCRTSPVGYLEGIYVRPTSRSSGVGRKLVEAAEAWARRQGCTEMASDRELDNARSGRFHRALGYEEVERIVCFRKDLGGA
ncbi:MAG: GNAT family N-acetyltransferase [Gemmatimonadota bacterium]